MTDTDNGAELRQIIEQLEWLDAEKADTMQAAKDVMQEAKSRGYEPAILRKVIALRKRAADDVAEEEAILEVYKAALGM